MGAKEILFQYKSLIIIIVLFLLAFSVRAEAANIGGVPDQMKSYYQDQTGLPYFSEMDSYYNFRLTQDLINHGYLGDAKINETQWDLHSSYPAGKSAEYPPLIAYITEIGCLIANLFAKIPLVTISFWIGTLIASLAVIPAYLLVKKITNEYGGITAGLLVGLAPSYFAHTLAGFFDTDMFNMLIPLLVTMFFVMSILANNFRNGTIYASLAAISMFLFTLAWQGWWHIYYLIIASAAFYVISNKYIFHLKPKESIEGLNDRLKYFNDKPELFTLLVFLILSLILMVLFFGVTGLLEALAEPIDLNQIQAAVQTTSYPNVYISVAELQIPEITNIINGVGGYLPFFFGFLGVAALCWNLRTNKEKKEVTEKKTRKPRRRGKPNRRRKEYNEHKEDKITIKPDIWDKKRNYIFYIILLTTWLLITIYAMTKGLRFIENFSLPISLSAGIFVGLLYDYIKDRVANNSYQTIIMVIIVISVTISPVTIAYGISSSVVPGTDDSMVNSLEWVKNNTSNNTIITSWWDYGHLFTAVANRPVTFDGSSQNSPRAYWVAKVFLTSNETLSAGILRMLASSGDKAPLLLDDYTKSSGKGADILNSILGLDKQSALTIMTTKYDLTLQQAQNVVQYTHPENPAPDILITSSDMIQKAGWWSYFGSWNFTTNSGANYQYLTAQMNSTTVNNKTLLIGSNAVVAQANGTRMSAGLLNTSNIKTSDKNQILNQISTKLTIGNGSLVIPPHKLTIISKDTITQTLVSNSSQYSILMINQNNTYISVAMNKELEDSLFTRLFFMGGEGLTHFKSLYGQQGVIVWGVTY